MNVKTSIVFLLVLGISISLIAENYTYAEIPDEIQILKWEGDEYWYTIQDLQDKIASTNNTEIKALYQTDLDTAQTSLDGIILEMQAIGVPTVEEQMEETPKTAGACRSCDSTSTKTLKFKGAYEYLLYGLFPWTNVDISWTYADVMGHTEYSIKTVSDDLDKIKPYYYFGTTQGPLKAKVQLDYLVATPGYNELDSDEHKVTFNVWSSMSSFKLPMNSLGSVVEDTHIQFGVKPLRVQ